MSRANECCYPAPTSLDGTFCRPVGGLTIREHFAAMMMQGFLSTGHAKADSAEKVPELLALIAKVSAQAADALIAELAKGAK